MEVEILDGRFAGLFSNELFKKISVNIGQGFRELAPFEKFGNSGVGKQSETVSWVLRDLLGAHHPRLA